MSCTATLLRDSQEEPVFGSSTARGTPPHALRQRRHSSYVPYNWAGDADNIPVMVDRFLVELNRRLEFLESYGQLNFDASVDRAWSTLHAVRDSCSSVPASVMDAGRRRAAVLVETLEARYNEALAQRETLEQKVYEGLKMMESYLADCEARAHSMRENGLAVTEAMRHFADRQHRRMGSTLELAKEAKDSAMDAAWRTAEKMESAVQRALQLTKEKGLLNISDLPAPWRTNEHILSGYRFHETKMACVRSVVTPSNETFNIWSHLVGLVIVLSIAFYFYPTNPHFNISSKTDVFIAGVFFFAACKCLVCSCMWHTFNSISSQNLMERFACVDYTGISMLVAASIVTTEYTAFYCEPVARWSWIAVTAVLGLVGTALAWHPTFNRYDMSWLRVGFFIALASSSVFPILQQAHARGWEWVFYFYAPVAKSLLVYTGGALLYALKVPERWAPGMFDYFGGSHNIWHVAVLAGILFHYRAMQEFFAHAFLRSFSQCSHW